MRPKVIELLKSGMNRKDIQKLLNIHYTQVSKIAEEEGLVGLLRTRAMSALDKVLSAEEITTKITDGSVYVGYNKETKKYAFKCTKTDKVFFKSSEHIKTISSPFGKSGLCFN